MLNFSIMFDVYTFLWKKNLLFAWIHSRLIDYWGTQTSRKSTYLRLCPILLSKCFKAYSHKRHFHLTLTRRKLVKFFLYSSIRFLKYLFFLPHPYCLLPWKEKKKHSSTSWMAFFHSPSSCQLGKCWLPRMTPRRGFFVAERHNFCCCNVIKCFYTKLENKGRETGSRSRQKVWDGTSNCLEVAQRQDTRPHYYFLKDIVLVGLRQFLQP